MEITKKKVITSTLFDNIDLLDIYEYGEATFGQKLAEGFIGEIYQSLGKLETQYLLHSECRHLGTKTKIYRNIILGSYLISTEYEPIKLKFCELFTEVVHQKSSNKLEKSKHDS